MVMTRFARLPTVLRQALCWRVPCPAAAGQTCAVGQACAVGQVALVGQGSVLVEAHPASTSAANRMAIQLFKIHFGFILSFSFQSYIDMMELDAGLIQLLPWLFILRTA